MLSLTFVQILLYSFMKQIITVLPTDQFFITTQGFRLFIVRGDTALSVHDYGRHGFATSNIKFETSSDFRRISFNDFQNALSCLGILVEVSKPAIPRIARPTHAVVDLIPNGEVIYCMGTLKDCETWKEERTDLGHFQIREIDWSTS